MSVRLAFQICTYLLIVDGLAALALAGLLEPAWWPFVILVVMASWLHDAVRARVSAVVQHRQLITILAVGFFALDLFYLAESLLDGFVHLLLFALFYKLYTRRTLRDSRDLLLLSFFMLVAASALTVSVGFLLILVVFLLLGTWTFVLYHLMWEAEKNAPDQAAALIESRDLVTPSLLGLSVAAAVASLLFTALFFVVIPRVGQAALPLRARLGHMVTGFSDRVELGSFGTIQTDASVVMRVGLPDGPADPEGLGDLRWRGVAFDHFSGREWSVTHAERRMVPRSAGGQIAVARPRGTGVLITQEIYLEPIGTEVLFAAPRLLGVTVSSGPVWVDTLDAVTSPVPQARLRYRALSELELPARGPTGAVRPLSSGERTRYLQLPLLSPHVPALALEVTRQSPDPWTAALRLTHHLQTTLRYSLELQRTPGVEPLEDFLFVGRSGNCEYFATSLAVLLRTLDIPARVVNGFQRGEWNPYGGYFTVHQRDAHSWVEAWIPERGWVTLDPSPRADFDSAWSSSTTFQYLDALRMRWHRYVVNWSLGDQLRASLTVRHQAVAWRRAFFAGGLTFPGGKRGAAIAVGAVLGVVGALFLWYRGIALVPVPTRRPATVWVYERMLRRLARLGLRPGRGETAREFCLRVADDLPDARAAVEEITGVYEAVRFGAAGVAPDEMERLGRLAATCGAPRG
jgi:transglutaminase-like putative cysteine protease